MGLLDEEKQEFLDRIDPRNTLRIERENLDEELAEVQLTMEMKLAREDARTHEDEKTSKSVLDDVKADLDKRIRKDPRKFGVSSVNKKTGVPKKPTENQISAAITIHPEYQRAAEVYQDAQFRRRLVGNLLTVVEHRGKMLEELSKRERTVWIKGRKEVSYAAINSLEDDLEKDLEHEVTLDDDQEVANLGGIANSKIKDLLNPEKE